MERRDPFQTPVKSAEQEPSDSPSTADDVIGEKMPSGTPDTFTLRIPSIAPLSSALASTQVDENLTQRPEQLGLENPFQLSSRLSHPSNQARTREDADPFRKVWQTDLEDPFRTPSFEGPFRTPSLEDPFRTPPSTPQSDLADHGEVQAPTTLSGEQAETHEPVNDVPSDRHPRSPRLPNVRCYLRLPNEQLDWARVSLKTAEDYENYRSRLRIPFHSAPSHCGNGASEHEFPDDDKLAAIMQKIEEWVMNVDETEDDSDSLAATSSGSFSK